MTAGEDRVRALWPADRSFEPVRVAVVGLGYWGPNLVRNGHELQEADVVWACDRREDAIKAIALRYPGVPRTNTGRSPAAAAAAGAAPVPTIRRPTRASSS